MSGVFPDQQRGIQVAKYTGQAVDHGQDVQHGNYVIG
jgi:hypothetical protein